MTDSLRRLEAAHGCGKPHCWPFCGGWACTLGRESTVAPLPCMALALLLAGMRA